MMPSQLPPAAAPCSPRDLLAGIGGLLRPDRAGRALVESLRSTLHVKGAWLFSSGRAGLTIALHALQAGSDRRSIVVPAYTCYSVPAAIVRAGLDVVCCDVDPATLDYDYAALERLLHHVPPLGVLSTHLLGVPANTARALSLSREVGAWVVEDAAQAFGVRHCGDWLGTAGDIGLFSFGRGKVLSAAGGGAVVTRSDALAREVERLHDELPDAAILRGPLRLAEAALTTLLLVPSLYWMPAGLPYLGLGETVYSTSFPIEDLSAAQAGLLRHWQVRARERTLARVRNQSALARACGVIRPPEHVPALRLPMVCPSREVRNGLLSASHREGLGLSILYPAALSGVPELMDAFGRTRFPGAEALADRLVTLPVHPKVRPRDIARIRALLRVNGLLEGA
jgi:perosamine synthetase